MPHGWKLALHKWWFYPDCWMTLPKWSSLSNFLHVLTWIARNVKSSLSKHFYFSFLLAFLDYLTMAMFFYCLPASFAFTLLSFPSFLPLSLSPFLHFFFSCFSALTCNVGTKQVSPWKYTFCLHGVGVLKDTFLLWYSSLFSPAYSMVLISEGLSLAGPW